MRDKQSPGDTYNYKEHVYADPVALRKEIEKDKQEEAGNKKVKMYQKANSPPPVPNGPRKGSSGNTAYAELEKKTNVPRSSVRELGSRFGGTMPRVGSRAKSEEDSPPPVPEVTESRNVLDDSPPNSPAEARRCSSLPNILSEDNALPPEGVSKPHADGEAAAKFGNSQENAPLEDFDTQLNCLDEQLETTSPVAEEEAVVVIDVRINSEAGIEIGAEIPTATDDASTADDGGVRLIKSVKRDPFAEETPLSETGSKAEPGSEVGSGRSTKRKKKDVESGFNSTGHLRRNLIIVSLFLLLVLILVSAAIVVLVNYTEILQ